MLTSRKVWTGEDDEALRYWHAFKLTDGRIARRLGCSRRTILRQREAIGLKAVGHPARAKDAGRNICLVCNIF